MRPRSALGIGVAALFAGLATLTGCSLDRQPGPKWTGGGTWGEHPFGPTTLRVHPLSHVDEPIGSAPGSGSGSGGGGGGESHSIIVLHVELKDRYGDTVKGLGTLVATLYRGAAPSAGGGDVSAEAVQQTRWEIPGMDDPDENARQFDPATRTYRIQLEAPTWMENAMQDGSRLRLRVVLDLGGGRTLSDEWGVRR